MSMYEAFADIYDVFMADAPYEPWMSFLKERFDLIHLDVIDMGCGTGQLTVPLSRLVRTCVGMDPSEAMLANAQMRAMDERAKVTWVCQNMQSYTTAQKFDLAIATCDVVNYIPSSDELGVALQRVYDSLKPSGCFAFDVIGPARLSMLREGYWHDIEEHAALIHETNVSGHAIVHDVIAFVEVEGGVYRRIDEQHQQTYYEIDELRAICHGVGFRSVDVFGDFLNDDWKHADRVVCVAHK